MRPSNRGAFRQQVNVLRRQFLQDGGLPFTDVLTDGVLTEALSTVGAWLDHVVGIGRDTRARQHGVGPDVPEAGTLQHHDRGALADHEPVSRHVDRPGRVFRIVVTQRMRPRPSRQGTCSR